jgi:hypothetical protein
MRARLQTGLFEPLDTRFVALDVLTGQLFVAHQVNQRLQLQR